MDAFYALVQTMAWHETEWQLLVADVVNAKARAAVAIANLVAASAALADVGETMARRVDALNAAGDMMSAAGVSDEQRQAAAAFAANERAAADLLRGPLEAAKQEALFFLEVANLEVVDAQTAMKAGIDLEVMFGVDTVGIANAVTVASLAAAEARALLRPPDEAEVG